ncbi:hypothetical protein GCM10023195_01670 [Actinoallomurus liliacearum]|uniref:PDZ domain-containing protein n=2 Tax=Actinoallomurus liliacearum TaxID=1080073 RepID=A0ABP8TAN6_9ACTN
MVLAMGAGLAGAGMGSATAATPTAAATPVQAPSPQTNVPDLDAPGPAKTVEYPPDYQTRSHPDEARIEAPQYTRITGVDPHCPSPMICPVDITPDGKSATVKLDGTNWTWTRPWAVHVAANSDAPLAGGAFTGTLTFEGVTLPLRVNITAGGAQAIFGGYVANASGGGGVKVNYVEPGSKAEMSGILPNDVITTLNGQPTPTVSAFHEILAGKRAGQTVPVVINRNGATMALQLTLDGA